MHFDREFRAIPYSPHIHIVVCDDIDVARRSLELMLYDKSNWDTQTLGRFYLHRGKGRKTFRPYLFINVPKHENFFELMDTVVHESDHIANRILDYSGVETTYDNDEAHTYLQGYIVEQVLKLFFDNQESLSLAKENIVIHVKNN